VAQLAKVQGDATGLSLFIYAKVLSSRLCLEDEIVHLLLDLRSVRRRGWAPQDLSSKENLRGLLVKLQLPAAFSRGLGSMGLL
jgi:hypothetical protein